MNSNTFQDSPGQKRSYKFGSLSHADKAVRDQAVAHNIECIEIGEKLGSKALTVWIGDGSNFPGQSNFTRAFERYLDAMKTVVKALPVDWRIFTEHKLYEAGVLFDRDPGLGHQLPRRAGARAEGVSASSTSATTRPTSTSR